MNSTDEQVLRAAKEIAVKFIETGRIYPASFREAFTNIYNSVEEAVKGSKQPAEQENGKDSTSTF
jgi:hypothetical protein